MQRKMMPEEVPGFRIRRRTDSYWIRCHNIPTTRSKAVMSEAKRNRSCRTDRPFCSARRISQDAMPLLALRRSTFGNFKYVPMY